MVRIAVTGQCLVHGPVDPAGAGPLRAFLDADAAFANLEASVAAAGAWPTKTKTLHLAEPAALAALRDLGFHALAHANNHAFDLGPPGIEATRRAAMAAGLGLTGSGGTAAAALTPALAGGVALFSVDLGPQPDIVYAGSDRAGIAPLRVVRRIVAPPEEFGVLARMLATLGDDRRLAARAAVGYAEAAGTGRLNLWGTEVEPGPALAARWELRADDLAPLAAGIAAAKAAGRPVAVALHSHHWEADWRVAPDSLLDVARRLIDLGADLVFGTGAPVLQPVAFHRGRAILPGLGNLVFHTRRAARYDETGVDVWRSVAARVTLDAAGVCTALELLPVAVGRPAAADGPAPAPVPLIGADREAIWTRAISALGPEERARVMLG